MVEKHYNVTKFVEHYFPDARLSSSGTEYVVLCPWHEGTKRKLYISATHGMYNCFSCGIHGSFFSLVRRVLILNKNKDVFDALKIYESSEPLTFLNDPDVRPSSGGSTVIEYPEGYFPFYTEEPLGESGRAAKAYLNDRGITEEQISYYKLGFCATGKYAHRIIVPVLDDEENLVSFVARDYTGHAQAKVLTPAALLGTSGIKDYVYNLHNAKRTRELIIGEGVFDAMALGVSGIGKGIGYDCSGLAQVCLVKLGMLSPKAIDRTAQSLFNLCTPITIKEAKLGDLVFYGTGPKRVTHVVVYLGNGFALGANGGTSKTNADNPKAYVKIDRYNYRSDIVGIGRFHE
jgi:hypothetical protein